MHNAAALALGLDRVYVAHRVATAALPKAIAGLAALGFDGANVTVPHKAAAFACCDLLSDEAAAARAVNTLCFEHGSVTGHLTDGLGLLDAVSVVPAAATIVGAGGSARAAASALLRAGTMKITIIARNSHCRAELGAALAQIAPAAEIDADDNAVPTPGLLVHCTPVGGISALEELPVPADVVSRMTAVADFAYRADGSETPLVAAARAQGIATIDGLELLVRQGARSFTLWTGIAAPLDVMRRAVAAPVA